MMHFVLDRSPMYSHVSATLQGLCTIRALKTQPQFLKRYNKYQDRHTSTWFLILTGVRWLGFRLDMLCFVFFAIVVFAPLVAREAGRSMCICKKISISLCEEIQPVSVFIVTFQMCCFIARAGI